MSIDDSNFEGILTAEARRTERKRREILSIPVILCGEDALFAEFLEIIETIDEENLDWHSSFNFCSAVRENLKELR